MENSGQSIALQPKYGFVRRLNKKEIHSRSKTVTAKGWYDPLIINQSTDQSMKHSAA
jgi:hypothetical protein